MAATRRQERIAALIKKEVSLIIDQKLKHPGVGFATVNRVKMSPDLRIADIYFSVLGGETGDKALETEKALKHSEVFIKNELKPFLKLRFMPELRFYYDDSLEYAEKIDRLIDKIHDSANPDPEE